MTTTRSRLRIERLELDLRGIPPSAANAAVRGLGPALARSLDPAAMPAQSAQRLDAGRVTTTAAPDPGGLAATIAQRIAGTLSKTGKGQS